MFRSGSLKPKKRIKKTSRTGVFCVLESMKQTFEVEEKLFTSSLNICTSTVQKRAVEPSTYTLFAS
jgi:hypothetical protein